MAAADGDGRSLDWLVLGAGIAGLLAARTLRDAGWRVAVVDKGRGVGGRMATRRVGEARCDHGAQFFTCRDPAFAALVATWTAAGAATEWYRGVGDPAAAGHARHRGVPGMTAVPKRLAADLDVRLGVRVVALAAGPDGWLAHLDGGGTLAARGVVASAPVPQTLALLDAAGTALPAAVRAALDEVAYDPCLAVLARLARPSGLAAPGAVPLDDGPLRWIADNQVKGVSAVPALTLHASVAFSREHFDAAEDVIVPALLAAARTHADIAVAEVQVHRWRYAEPTRGPAERCVASALPAPIVCCGDAFGAPRVEGAALSGLAAGRCASALLGGA